MSAYDIASAWMAEGVTEVAGDGDNFAIMSMLTLDNAWPEHDEVPWCAGFVGFVAMNARLHRSKSLRARSWLTVGEPIELENARAANDVVILSRGSGQQPGPENVTAPGHVGFYVAHEPDKVYLLGGNQNDSVNIRSYPIGRLLGVRRLQPIW